MTLREHTVMGGQTVQVTHLIAEDVTSDASGNYSGEFQISEIPSEQNRTEWVTSPNKYRAYAKHGSVGKETFITLN